jgi:hypothetical protein
MEWQLHESVAIHSSEWIRDCGVRAYFFGDARGVRAAELAATVIVVLVNLDLVDTVGSCASYVDSHPP